MEFYLGRWPNKYRRAAGPTDIAGPLALQILPGRWPYKNVAGLLALVQDVDEILGRFGVGMILISDKSYLFKP